MRERRDGCMGRIAKPMQGKASANATFAQFCHQFDVNSVRTQTQGIYGKSGKLGKAARLPDEMRCYAAFSMATCRSSRWSVALQTRSTDIFRIAQLPAPRRFRPAEVSRAACRHRCPRPNGPQAVADDAPNSATHGVPTAAARCRGPVSDPMNSRAPRRIDANSMREVGGAIVAAPPEPATIISAQARSCGPPHVTTLESPRDAKCRATSANRSEGQRFESQPAPGLRAT